MPIVAQLASEVTGASISERTARRTLSDLGYRRRIARSRPLLTRRQRLARLAWARQRVNWPICQWHRVIFSDEKIFRATSCRGGYFVTRTKGEEDRPECVASTVKRGPQIHVWGAIGFKGVAPLKRVEGSLSARSYQTSIVNDIGVTCNNLHGGRHGPIFMQDGAPAHTARTTMELLEVKGLQVLPWPGCSPDFNPIENIWAYVQKRLPRNLPRNDDALWEEVQRTWQQTPRSLIRRFFASIPRRLESAIKLRGGATSY